MLSEFLPEEHCPKNNPPTQNFRDGGCFAANLSAKNYDCTIRGVMKKINSWFELLTAWRLNRLPSQGILPSNGTCCTFTELVVWMTPPITIVPPSVTST